MTSTATARPVSQSRRQPAALLSALEPTRAWVEFGAFLGTWPALKLAPRGDGHPVIVLPGFFAGDASTRVLRSYLRSLGYAVSGWSLGRNRGPTRAALKGMDDLVAKVVQEQGRPASIIGWSLGGIFARQIASRRPADVRQVITLASPYRLNRGDRTRATSPGEVGDSDMRGGISVVEPGGGYQALPMPATSIYTRTDGVVAWQTCTEPETSRSQNIEVFSSHCGVGHHPAAMYAIADRLAQPVDRWLPFQAPKLIRHLYPSHVFPSHLYPS